MFPVRNRIPPLTKQKLTLTPPSPTDNIKVNLPSPLPPPIGALIPNLRVGCLPEAQKSTSNDSSTHVSVSPSESRDSDSELVSSSHELLHSSSSVPSLAAFPFDG